MQKDIRHYDMKEVKFEQDTDRRFLTLEVSTHLNCTWLEYVFFSDFILNFLPVVFLPSSLHRKRKYAISEINVKNDFFP